MEKKRKYNSLIKLLILCILQAYIFSFYAFLFFTSLTMQIITNTVYQMFIKTWYKYGLSVSFLTIENHKKIGNKYKYRPFL